MNMSVKPQTSASRALAGKVALVTGSTSGIGLGIARALAAAGADIVLNGLGVAAELDRTREQIAAEFGVKARFSPADMTRPNSIAENDRGDGCAGRPPGYPDQQCRHPARCAAGAVSGREMGPDPRDQSVVGLPHHAARAARNATERVRADHQHRLRARPGRLAVQGGLRRRQARHRRAHQGDRAGDGRRGHYLQRDLSRLCLYATGRGADRWAGQGAWNLA
ncbi:hypothetical protein ACVWZ6_003848 [Bradyrhizobium sp. GM6.1]